MKQHVLSIECGGSGVRGFGTARVGPSRLRKKGGVKIGGEVVKTEYVDMRRVSFIVGQFLVPNRPQSFSAAC